MNGSEPAACCKAAFTATSPNLAPSIWLRLTTIVLKPLRGLLAQRAIVYQILVSPSAQAALSILSPGRRNMRVWFHACETMTVAGLEGLNRFTAVSISQGERHPASVRGQHDQVTPRFRVALIGLAACGDAGDG